MKFEINQLIDLIEKSPVGQEIIAERKAEIIAERRQVVKEIEQIDIELEKSAATYTADVEKVDEDLKKAFSKLLSLRARKSQLLSEHGQVMSRLERRRDVLRGQLEDTADGELKSKIQELVTKLVEMRVDPELREEVTAISAPAREDIPESARTKKVFSNLPAIEKTSDFIRACLDELREMMLQAEPDFSRIDELLKSIPDCSRVEVGEVHPPGFSRRFLGL